MLPSPFPLSRSRQTLEIARPLNQRRGKSYIGRIGSPLHVGLRVSVRRHVHRSKSNGLSRNPSAIPLPNTPNGYYFARRPFGSTTSRSALGGVKGIPSRRSRVKSVLGAPKPPSKEKAKPQAPAALYAEHSHNVFDTLAEAAILDADGLTPAESFNKSVNLAKESHGAQMELESVFNIDSPSSTTTPELVLPGLDGKYLEAPISQISPPVLDKADTSDARRDVTEEVTIPQKQDPVPQKQDLGDLPRDSALPLSRRDKKKAKTAKQKDRLAEKRPVKQPQDTLTTDATNELLTLFPEQKDVKQAQDALAARLIRELPTLTLSSIEQSLHPGWKKISKYKQEYDLMRDRRQKLLRFSRFKKNTDVVLAHAKRIQTVKTSLSTMFHPVMEGLFDIPKKLTQIHSLNGHKFCNDYVRTFEMDKSNIRTTSHEWRGVVHLRLMMAATVPGKQGGRWVYHRARVHRLIWRNFMRSGEKIVDLSQSILKGPKGLMEPKAYVHLKKLWRENRSVLVKGGDYRTICVSKGVREFFFSRPKTDIHWQQLDLCAPFEEFRISSIELMNFAGVVFRAWSKPVYTENGFRYDDRPENLRLKRLVMALRQHNENQVLPRMEQIFELNWLRLKLQELNIDPEGAHRTYPEFRPSKPLSQSPKLFEQWVCSTTTGSTGNSGKSLEPLSDQKPNKLVRRLKERKS